MLSEDRCFRKQTRRKEKGMWYLCQTFLNFVRRFRANCGFCQTSSIMRKRTFGRRKEMHTALSTSTMWLLKLYASKWVRSVNMKSANVTWHHPLVVMAATLLIPLLTRLNCIKFSRTDITVKLSYMVMHRMIKMDEYCQSYRTLKDPNSLYSCLWWETSISVRKEVVDIALFCMHRLLQNLAT